MSWQAMLFNSLLKVLIKPVVSRTVIKPHVLSISRQLLNFHGNKLKKPPYVHYQAVDVNNIAGEWVSAGASVNPAQVILYLHGGGFVVGSSMAYRDFTWRLSEAACAKVLIIDYRLAPEHTYPAALEDALTAYHWLLSQGYSSRQIIIAGDSAGGNLTLATAITLKEQGVDMPCALVCISPWNDLSVLGKSVRLHAQQDPMIPAHRLIAIGKNYVGNQDPKNPKISPVYADYTDLPPLSVHVGSTEVLYDDSMRIVEKARAAGILVSFKVWNGLPHAFPIFARVLPEGKAAIIEIGRFIMKQFAAANSANKANETSHSS